MGKKKKIVQWQIENLRDEKYSENTNDAIIESSKILKKDGRTLKIQ